VRYQERLWVPAWYWLIVVGVAASFVVAIWAYLGMEWGLGTAAVVLAIGAALVIGYGGVQVRVSEDALHVGHAHVDWRWTGPATALDPATTARKLGPESDHSAYLVTRPYIATAIELPIHDDADPHHRWLVSTRRPEALASAINAARTEAGARTDD